MNLILRRCARLFTVLSLTSAFSLGILAQAEQPGSSEKHDTPSKERAGHEVLDTNIKSSIEDKAGVAAAKPGEGGSAAALGADEPSAIGNEWYTAPTPEERRTRYLKSLVGPVAIIRHSVKAGILTARNAPKEWNPHWDGFGRRFASNFAQGAIKNSVQFSLDGALDVDSHYYLSRDRHPAARARNAVFSAVTARDRRGRRVIGIPAIAGSLAANVASAELWYPSRYNYVHGLKGSAITLAVDAGVNLFREFIWKH